MSTPAPPTLPATASDLSIYYLFVLSGAMAAQMGVAVEFTSRVDENALARALHALIDTEPVLGYRFVADSPGPIWERVDLPESDAVLPVKETSDPEADIHSFLASRFDACEGPQVRGLLLRAPDHDVLALQISHVAVDGRGSIETLYRLCEIHGMLTEDPDWYPPFNGDSIRDFAAAGVPASLRERAASVGALATSLTAGGWRLPPDSGGRGTDAFILASVGPELLSTIKEVGRARGATVNDLLLTAYFQALRGVLKPECGAKAPISIGADLRRYLSIDGGWGLSNYAAFIGLPLVAIEKNDFNSALAQVVERMQVLKGRLMRELAVSRVMADVLMGGTKSRLWRPMLTRMSRLMGKSWDAADGGTGPVLTNLGEIDSERVRFGDGIDVEQARWFLQIGHAGALALGAASFRNRLQLCMSVDPTGIDPEVPRAIVDGIVRELEEWTSGSGGRFPGVLGELLLG